MSFLQVKKSILEILQTIFFRFVSHSALLTKFNKGCKRGSVTDCCVLQGSGGVLQCYSSRRVLCELLAASFPAQSARQSKAGRAVRAGHRWFLVLEKLGVSVKHTNALVVTWGTSS